MIQDKDRAWVITLTSLSALDTATTVLLLRRGFAEFNPIVLKAIEITGMTQGVIIFHTLQVATSVIMFSLIKRWSRLVAVVVLLFAMWQITLASLSNVAFCFNWTWFPYDLIERLLGY